MGVSDVLLTKSESLTHVNMSPYFLDDKDKDPSWTRDQNTAFANRFLNSESKYFANLTFLQLNFENVNLKQFEMNGLRNLINLQTIFVSAVPFPENNIPQRLLNNIFAALPLSIRRIRLILHSILINELVALDNTPAQYLKLDTLELYIWFNEINFALQSAHDRGLLKRRLGQLTRENFTSGFLRMFHWITSVFRRLIVDTEYFRLVHQFDGEQQIDNDFLHGIAKALLYSTGLPSQPVNDNGDVDSNKIEQHPLENPIIYNHLCRLEFVWPS
ncbi:hypothetical protein HDU76_004143 [Blyttiomyces sp. JEL0837]|nr:hypothetical protein HDU76_004143 [Blyttiomyces sp. JEL0837]